MLAIVTGFLASGLRVLALPRHVHLLAPRGGIMLPQRGGTTGGYLGMAQGPAMMVLGLVALLGRRLLGVEAPIDPAAFTVGALLVIAGLTLAYRLLLLEAHVHPHSTRTFTMVWRTSTSTYTPLRSRCTITTRLISRWPTLLSTGPI